LVICNRIEWKVFVTNFDLIQLKHTHDPNNRMIMQFSNWYGCHSDANRNSFAVNLVADAINNG